MESISNLIQETKKQIGTSKELSFKELQVQHWNEEEGTMSGNDCRLCRNKGYIMILQDGYQVLKECKCLPVRKSLLRIKRSGLEKLLDEYTFDKFKTEKAWQKHIKDTALNYVENTFGNWFYIGGQVGCVDCDTEYFNGTKWKKISEYTQGEKVLQYIPPLKNYEGRAILVNPTSYIKQPAKTLWKIETDRGSIDQCLSLNHNFAYLSSKGNFNKKPFHEVIDMHNSTIQGFYGKVITTFEYSGKGIDLSDDEIRLMVAVIADGYFPKKQLKCKIRVKKQRKKNRLEALLLRLKLEYKRWDLNGYSTYAFYAPRREKHFTSFWYNCNNEQLKVIADEVLHWDGSINGKRRLFSTSNKESAEFVQFTFSATGNRATISVLNRIDKLHKKIEYTVLISNNKLISLAKSISQNKKSIIREVPTKDGYQYCFTVPSGNLVLRRNKRIFITGNSGKSHICTSIVINLINRGNEALYMKWRDDSINMKRSIMSDDQVYADEMNKYKTVKVLYIDDFFKTERGKSPSAADINLAFELLNYRYNNKDLVTIISSELSMQELLDIDEAIGSRIYQRSKGYYLAINKDSSKNMRMKGNTL